MSKIRVLQQYMDVGNIGGLRSEFLALTESTNLNNQYEFIPMILKDYHHGINLHDIRFYYKKVKEANPDIVHIRGAGVESLNAVIGAKLAASGKILVTVHGMYSDLVFYNVIKKWICRHIIEKVIFSLSDGISCVCKTTSERTCFNKYKDKMLPFVYNRIPQYTQMGLAERKECRQLYDIPLSAKLGIYVGRITKEKGLSYLTEALKKLDNEWPEKLYFLVVGDGDYLCEMENACKLLRHSKNIIFLGEQIDVRQYLLISDFFVLPSLHENLSIAILEACAARLPCLVTKVGGNVEIIDHNVTGIVISPASSIDLCVGILDMCNDKVYKELKENIGNYDFSVFSDYNVDRQLDRVYKNLLKNVC